MNVKKMILSSMLITNALTIFIIEAQLPPIAPIPGIKLGLANVVTLFAIYLLGYKEAAKIHILRIVLGSIFTCLLYTSVRCHRLHKRLHRI